MSDEYLKSELAEGYDLIPSHTQGAIERYILNGIPPGSFLTAVLSNDLKEAVARADAENQRNLVNWVKFLYNHVPGRAWGSPAAVKAWYEDFLPEKEV